jgi:hypothetical protein
MRIRRFLTTAVATAVVLAGTAGPAAALTTYHAGPVGYRCTFPGVAQQTLSLAEAFSGPDSVSPGATFAITGVSGTLTLPNPVHALTWVAWSMSCTLGAGQNGAFSPALPIR